MLRRPLPFRPDSGDADLESLGPAQDEALSTEFTAAIDEVAAPERILGLLRHVLRAHNVLGVNLAGEQEIFSSALLEIVPDQHYLVLDELAPRSGHHRVSVGTVVTVRTRIAGVYISFDAEVTGVGQENGVAYYRLPLPERLHYEQRREYFRAPIPLERVVEVQLLTRDHVRLTGELRDISVGGMSARLRRASGYALAPGDVLPRCMVNLPNLGRLCCGLEVCYAEQGAKLRVPRIGGRFIDLDLRMRRQIEQFVVALDREHHRRQIAVE